MLARFPVWVTGRMYIILNRNRKAGPREVSFSRAGSGRQPGRVKNLWKFFLSRKKPERSSLLPGLSCYR